MQARARLVHPCEPCAALHDEEVGPVRLEQAQREQDIPVKQGQGGVQSVSWSAEAWFGE